MTLTGSGTPRSGGSGDAEGVLAARLRAGDEAAFETIVREFGPRLLATARRIMGHEEDAQEALQDGLLSAFKAASKFEGGALVSTWLHRIIVNACLMKLRSKRRRPEVWLDSPLPGPKFMEDGHRANPGPAWNPPEASGIETQELRRLVQSAIEQLPEPYRVVLVLRDMEGLDTEAVATALEMTPGAVKTRLHRARQALKEVLEPHMTEDDSP